MTKTRDARTICLAEAGAPHFDGKVWQRGGKEVHRGGGKKAPTLCTENRVCRVLFCKDNKCTPLLGGDAREYRWERCLKGRSSGGERGGGNPLACSIGKSYPFTKKGTAYRKERCVGKKKKKQKLPG